MSEAQLTREQIAEYQRQQAQKFLEKLNQFLNDEDFTIIAIPIIDNEGRIRAEIKVVPKQ